MPALKFRCFNLEAHNVLGSVQRRIVFCRGPSRDPNVRWTFSASILSSYCGSHQQYDVLTTQFINVILPNSRVSNLIHNDDESSSERTQNVRFRDSKLRQHVCTID